MRAMWCRAWMRHDFGMDILLIGVVLISMASVGVAVVALFLAIRHARREHADFLRKTAACIASSFPRHRDSYSVEDTVPGMRSRLPEWDSR